MKKIPNIEHIAITNEFKRHNLQLLAEYLTEPELKAAFDISRYCENIFVENTEDCGSVGCAIGHGPYAGIKKETHESWNEYAKRCFVNSIHKHEYAFMFECSWADVDNTPEGAAKRIAYALEHGVPNERFVGVLHELMLENGI